VVTAAWAQETLAFKLLSVQVTTGVERMEYVLRVIEVAVTETKIAMEGEETFASIGIVQIMDLD